MKNNKKIASILIIASIVLFAGCSSSKVAATPNNNTNATTNSQKRKFDPTAMKTLYSSSLKDLVTAGTITQDQSDKVLAALTTNVPKGTGTNKSASKSSGTGKATGTRPKNNRLSALVSSSVITQAQADTINQKFQEAMKNNQTKQN